MQLEWDFSEFYAFADKLGDISRFEETIKKTAREISKALLRRMKDLTPVDGYDLINGWGGNKFLVREVTGGFEVDIVNTTAYALSVNDGHKAHNQFGGPYEVKRRVQVRNPHQWQKGDPTYYVFGHFFVERGILQMTHTKEIELLIMKELEKWWEGCF